MAAVGKMGAGKSHTTKAHYILPYHKAQGKSVVVFSPNREKHYDCFDTLYWDVEDIWKARKEEEKTGHRIVTKSEGYLAALRPGEIRVVLPITRKGRTMNTQQMQLTTRVIFETFHDGLMLFDDINKYINHWQATWLLGGMKTIRHNRTDTIMHMQSVDPFRRIHWEALSLLRLHHDRIDVSHIASKIPQNLYPLLRIAQIVLKAYQKQHPQAGKYMYLLLDLDAETIRTPDGHFLHEAWYRYAAGRYLAEDDPRMVRRAARSFAEQRGKLRHTLADVKAARTQWVEDHLHYCGLQGVDTPLTLPWSLNGLAA